MGNALLKMKNPKILRICVDSNDRKWYNSEARNISVQTLISHRVQAEEHHAQYKSFSCILHTYYLVIQVSHIIHNVSGIWSHESSWNVKGNKRKLLHLKKFVKLHTFAAPLTKSLFLKCNFYEDFQSFYDEFPFIHISLVSKTLCRPTHHDSIRFFDWWARLTQLQNRLQIILNVPILNLRFPQCNSPVIFTLKINTLLHWS